MFHFDLVSNEDERRQRDDKNKKDDDNERPTNELKQQPVQKKRRKSSSRMLLLALAVLAAAGAAWHLLPMPKGFWQTAKAAAGLSTDVALTAIVYSEDNPLAMIDGQIVHEGDVIDGVRVVQIYKDKVDFEKADRRWTQHMPAAKKASKTSGSSLPVLLELGSDRCPPCRRMTPILNKLRSEYAGRFQIRYIDVRKDAAAGAKYGVRAIPTQIFYDSKGREVFRHVGFYSKRDILATWNQCGVKP
jgi:thioredoxin 1